MRKTQTNERILEFLAGHIGEYLWIKGRYAGRVRRYKFGELRKKILEQYDRTGGGDLVYASSAFAETSAGVKYFKGTDYTGVLVIL